MSFLIGQSCHLKSALIARNSQFLRTYRVASTYSANKRMPSCARSLRVIRVWRIISSTVCSKRKRLKNSSRLEMMKSSLQQAIPSWNHRLMTQFLSARRLDISPSSTCKVLSSKLNQMALCIPFSARGTESAITMQVSLAIVKLTLLLCSCRMLRSILVSWRTRRWMRILAKPLILTR